jgi:ribosomal protein L11 methyltransferase
MAPSLAGRLGAGGRLILSGILVEAAPPVEDAYRAAGLRIARRLDDEGWRALVFQR